MTPEVFAGACRTVEEKKNLDTSKARLEIFAEGLCVQCMHIGPFDDEPAAIEMMDTFIRENGFVHDFAGRRHHEIYLSDPRKTDPAKMKTILRIPVRKA
ncbi:GyrI-like domain-containing protein [uncultured Methanocorpusculum sp.]|nr:GyrI-like domain-containing protein [uncultured Methanocorpusculum sp.]